MTTIQISSSTARVSRYTITGPIGRYAHLAAIFGLDADQRHTLLANGDPQMEKAASELTPVVHLARPSAGEDYLLIGIDPDDPWTALAVVERGYHVVLQKVDLEELARDLITSGDALEIDRDWRAGASAADYLTDALATGRLNPHLVVADADAPTDHWVSPITPAGLAAFEELIAMGLEVFPAQDRGAQLIILGTEGEYPIYGARIGEDVMDEDNEALSPAVRAVLDRHGLSYEWIGGEHLEIFAPHT